LNRAVDSGATNGNTRSISAGVIAVEVNKKGRRWTVAARGATHGDDHSTPPPSRPSPRAADRVQDGASHADRLALELVAAVAAMLREQAVCLAEGGSPGLHVQGPGSRDTV